VFYILRLKSETAKQENVKYRTVEGRSFSAAWKEYATLYTIFILLLVHLFICMTKHVSLSYQYVIGILLVLVTAGVCWFAESFLGYRAVALLLLLVVSLLAIVFEILPVLASAVLSAVIWNFLFIPPVFTFHIAVTEDALLFLMYFVIALLNAVLTSRIRKAEKKAIEQEEKEHTIKLYNTLLNSLSHELRTPIATVISALDVLKDDTNNLSEHTQKDLLNEIDIASMRLNTQVENLLNMSRLQSGFLTLKLDWCDVNELMYNVIQKSYSDTTNHSIQFTPDEQLPLYKLDAGLMEQVLLNILSNALLYTPDDTVVIIETMFNPAHLIIRISDSGKGFPDSELPKVFDTFYRIPNSKTGGTGLGLSIAKGYVEAHHGSISVHNKSPHGAVFTILLPCEYSSVNTILHE
jgi:two-component system sensor histidine kinase KdpD